MKKLKNVLDDKIYLCRMLPVKAQILFNNVLVEGLITGIDIETGYCNWNKNNIPMPIVRIDMIKI